MIAKNSIKVLLLVLLALPLSIFASGGGSQEEFSATDMIMHHIQDSHEWHLWGKGEDSMTIPLPVILKTEGGLVTFMSSEFHHDDTGSHKVVKNGVSFVKYHDKIYQLNSGESSLVVDAETHAVSNAIKPLDFSITKNVAMLFLVSAIMLLLFLPLAKFYKKGGNSAPKGLANVLETLLLFVRDEIARPNIGEKKYMK